MNGSDVVEIGVVLGEKEVADMLEDAHGELTMNGEPIKAFFNEGTGTQRVPGRIVAIPVPATYEVSASTRGINAAETSTFPLEVSRLCRWGSVVSKLSKSPTGRAETGNLAQNLRRQ